MAYLAVCDNGDEYIFKSKQVPLRLELDKGIKLLKGLIKKLTSRELAWGDLIELK